LVERVSLAPRGTIGHLIHHYYPLGRENVGDHSSRAIRGAVTRHFGDAEFVYFPVNDRYKATTRTIGCFGDNLAKTNAEPSW